MQLLFILAEFLVLLLLAINFRQQLQGASFFGTKLQHILQGFAGMRVGVIVDVLPRQAVPVFNLLFAAPVLDLALQGQRGGVVGLDLQRLLQFLKSQRIFVFLKSRPGRIQQLRQSLAADSVVELAAERLNVRVHVAFGFDLAEDFAGKLEIAVSERFGGTLQSRASTLRIEELDGFVPQSFAECVAQFARARETMPALLRHAFVDDPADRRRNRGIHFRSRGRDLIQDGFDHLVRASALERVSTRQGFVANDAQREDVRSSGKRLQLDLLGRHVEQSSLLRARGMGVRHVRHAEVDDLDRIIFHDEDVARLQVAVHQAAFVRRLQAAAGLGHNLDCAFDGEMMARLANKVIESRAGQERHDEVRFLLPFFFKFSDVKDLDDVGMAHRGENIALFVEQLKRGRIGNVEDCLDGDFAADDGVVGAIDQPHATLPEDLPDFVAAG